MLHRHNKMLLIIVSAAAITVARANLYQECAKFFGPNNYMHNLPSLQLPYMGHVPIPISTPKIKPSPVVRMKAVSVVTKYIYKNPVCVKYTKKKSMCKPDNTVHHKGNVEQLVTKEYFVRGREKELRRSRHRERDLDRGRQDEYVREPHNQDLEDYDEDEENNETNVYIQSSEDSRPFVQDRGMTPNLSNKQIHDMLIEDRLDQLETILPHYTRRRTYETSTITVTKVISNRRSMATLVVKNCIPQGYDFCSPKVKKRKSKVAQLTNNPNESHYFG